MWCGAPCSSLIKAHNGRGLIRNRMDPMRVKDPSSRGISFNFPGAVYVLYT